MNYLETPGIVYGINDTQLFTKGVMKLTDTLVLKALEALELYLYGCTIH